MANFFKEYHAELRAKRQAEAEQERKARNEEKERNEYIDGLKIGQKFKYSRYINSITKKPIIEYGYFIERFSDNCIWYSNTKENAVKDRGWTLSVEHIIL
jgi:hypothetical protein